MTSGVRVASRCWAWASWKWVLPGSSAKALPATLRHASAADKLVGVCMRQLCLSVNSGRKAGREPPARHCLVHLALAGGSLVPLRDRLLADQRAFQVLGAVDFDARPSNQQDGEDYCDHGEDRHDRVLAVRAW